MKKLFFMAKTYREKITERIIEREIVEDFVDVKLPQKRRFNNGDFITLFQKAVLELTVNGELTKNELRLFLYLIGRTELTNEIRLPVIEISKELKESKGNIYNALNGLKNRNVVIWDTKMKLLRLNYDVAYKGKIKDYPKLQYKDKPVKLLPSKPILQNGELPFPKM